MVKRSHELTDLDAEADVPYEETRLARAAPAARTRLFVLALIGAAAVLGFSAVAHAWGWIAAAVVVLGAGAFVRAGRLGGIVALSLVALCAVLLPLALAGIGVWRAWFPIAVSVALGLAAMPDLVTLARDAELQHAYGRWARRGEP